MTEMNVIIIGSLHHNTLGVVRSLGEAGIADKSIIVLLVADHANPKNLISSSKYISYENVFYVGTYSEIPTWLATHASDCKKVIICCSDGASEVVINAGKKLSNKYIFPNTKLPITELANKSVQDIIAAECGLNTPISMEYDVDEKIDWKLFPCIIKPYKSTTGAGKADVRVIYSFEELKVSIPTIEAEKIQIQQYIDKEMEFQLIGCSLNAGENIIIPGFTKLIRQPKNTNTGYLLYSPIEQLDYDKDAVEKFIRTIGYSGLFSVEFIRGKDGKDYFLEINMRNDGNAYCVESAGVNLPYIWVYYQTYGKMPDVPTTFTEPVHFIPDLNDVKLAFKQIGPFKWLKQFKEAQSHSIYNKQDMGPFKFEIKRQVKRVFGMK